MNIRFKEVHVDHDRECWYCHTQISVGHVETLANLLRYFVYVWAVNSLGVCTEDKFSDQSR